MGMYRKKPDIVEAVRWTGTNHDEIHSFVNHAKGEPVAWWENSGALMVETPQGASRASLGDWIVKGVSGEFNLCKPDIFEKTYERSGGVA